MAISRAQLLKELLPGLNALFGLEYARYGEEHKEIYETETSERSFEEETKLSGFSAAPVKNEGSAIAYDNGQEAWTARYNHETIALGFSLTVHYPDRLDEAEGFIRRALAKRPGDPAILDSYGWVLFRKGKVQDAVTPLKKAYGLFQDPEIAAHLGEVLWVMGRKAEARQIWLEAWRRDSQQQDMQRIYQSYPEVFTGAAK